MDYEEVLDKDKNASSSSSTEDDATTISNNSISCSSSNISSNSSVNYQSVLYAHSSLHFFNSNFRYFEFT